MRLWNEYEGTTIAGAFPLEKLIRPEGRSAFFSTVNGSGQPAVIRIIEAHFDEAEILARWQQVAALNQPHLLTLKQFGQTELEGTPLVYAVLETSDAELAAVLCERPLTLDETRQIALDLTPALQALHSANLIHEHIEPANVLAIGEIVKLRSDCIREAPEGAEGIALKARDVHDLATLLLECLTQSRTLATNASSSLPAPFNQVIRNALSGTWGLQQISDALAMPSPAFAPNKPSPAVPVNSPATPKAPSPTPAPPTAVNERIRVPLEPARPSLTVTLQRFIETLRKKPLWLAAAACALLLAIVVGWHELHSAPQPPITTLADSGPQPASARTRATTAAQPARIQAPKPAPGTAVGTTSSTTTLRWRVIAFTYNRREQAQRKVDALAQTHPDLHPEVFTPNGRAPFLVALGGFMSRDQALAFRSRVRSMGLPRDTYAQNYSGVNQ